MSAILLRSIILGSSSSSSSRLFGIVGSSGCQAARPDAFTALNNDETSLHVQAAHAAEYYDSETQSQKLWGICISHYFDIALLTSA